MNYIFFRRAFPRIDTIYDLMIYNLILSPVYVQLVSVIHGYLRDSEISRVDNLYHALPLG